MKQSKLYLVLAAILLGVVTFIATPAFASAQDAQPIEVDNTLASIQLSAATVTLLISLVIPVLVGIVTKATLSGYWKGLISLILNLASAAIITATVANGTAVWSKETLFSALIASAISVATYLGLYKPAGISSNGKLAPTKGIGPSS